MANSLLPAQNKEGHEYKFIHIDDFSPGVFDGSYISDATPIVSAPIGAAHAENTWCCASIVGGALGPLPGINLRGAAPGFPSPTQAFITGMAANLGLEKGVTELVMILEQDDGTTHWLLAYSDVVETGSINNIYNMSSVSAHIGEFNSAFPSWTRMSLQPIEGDAAFATPVTVLVWPADDANSAFGYLFVYPDPAAPTVFGVKNLIKNDGTTAGTGPIFCYEGRVLVFQGEGRSWPVAPGLSTNEQISVTDPPEGYTYPFQFAANIPNTTLLSPENPWGYGCWGSISVGEAIFIKVQGGAVIVNGDILSPSSVIPLPGVESTGSILRVGSADATQIGLAYCAENRGAWVWNGGNTSQKISHQIRDDFFDAARTAPGEPNLSYLFFVKRWQGWILFSNNYFYNTETKSWWVIYPNALNGDVKTPGRTINMWAQGRASNQMYATFNTVTDGEWWWQFDAQDPAPHYQWQSLPIHVVPTANRVCDVRHVYVRLSSPDGTGGTCTVTINGTVIGTTPPVTSADPTVYRFNAGIRTSDPIIQLNCDSAGGFTNSPPIVHSIDLEYRVRESEGSTN